MALLRIIDGQFSGRTFQLTGQLQSIGRHIDNEICINSPEIAKKHAEIRKIRDTFAIRVVAPDLNLLVNGSNVKKAKLSNGQTFSLGPIHLKFVDQVDSIETEALLYSVSFDPMSSGDPNKAPLGLSGSMVDNSELPVSESLPAPLDSEQQFAELPSHSNVTPLPKTPPVFHSGKLSQLDQEDSSDDLESGGRQREEGFLTEELYDVIAAVRNSNLEEIRQSSKGFPRPQLEMESSPKVDPFIDSESLDLERIRSAGDSGKTSVVEAASSISATQTGQSGNDLISQLVNQILTNSQLQRALVIAGIAGVIFISFLWFLFSGPSRFDRTANVLFVSPGQVILTELQFSPDDPPATLRFQSKELLIDYRKSSLALVNTDDLRIEWIGPKQSSGRGKLLIRAVKATQGQFQLVLGRSGSEITYPFHVIGANVIQRQAQARIENLSALGKPQIITFIKMQLKSGQSETQSQDIARFAKALNHYTKAAEGIEAFHQILNKSFDNEFLTLSQLVNLRLDSARQNLRREFESLVTRFKAAAKRADRSMQEKELRQIVRLLHNEQTFDYQRYRLIYESQFGPLEN